MILFLSNYYDIVSLLFLSLCKSPILILPIVRLFFFYVLDKKPLFAMIVFPVMTLKLYSQPAKIVVLFIQYMTLNSLIFGQQTLADLLISTILFFCMELLSHELIKAKQHVLLIICSGNILLFVITWILRTIF